MAFVDWFLPKHSQPDSLCPDCSWPEFVPFLDVVRVDTMGRKRVVGYVVRCAKCRCESVVSMAGVYQARERSPMPSPAAPIHAREVPERVLRDTDMPWEGKRKR